jgi:hypothetical protein
VAPVLGMWHSYKHAVNMVWKAYANEFIGPLFHKMYPGSQFRIQPSYLVQGTMMLSAIRIAYPLFREELKDALFHAEDDNWTPSSRAHVKNLFALCEYIIPTVSYMKSLQLSYITSFRCVVSIDAVNIVTYIVPYTP